ncbi:MAG: nucleotide exchange factor GrpE [bacterium]
MSKKSRRISEAPPPQPAPEPVPATDGGTPGEEIRSEAMEIEQRLQELEQELGRVRDDAEDANGRALRILAEFDTYRRRTDKERAAAVDRGAADVLRELLEVADNFDRALAHVRDDVPEAFVDGIRLVARSLHDVLDRRGVVRIEVVGKPFDPERHEALSSLPDDEAEPNTVLSEVQPGYMLGDRILRPAKVIVARARTP